MAHGHLLRPRRSALGRETLRRLGSVDTHGHRVLSLYLGFGPSQMPAHGFAASGFACPSCGRLAASAHGCPLDGATPAPQEDIVEGAIELARTQAAEVLIVRHLRDRLAEYGSIGALLRF
jgi:peptide subunit release factor 1 (eRF1)